MSNATLHPPRGARADTETAYSPSPAREPLVLCVDAATDVRSVAVARGSRVVARVREGAQRAQSSVLLAQIDEALREADVSLTEIELYAVARGPGSFTGLRAGLATIKAFASVLARSVAAVPTLEVVALSAGESARTIALIPAGRGEVFAQTFRILPDARVVALDAPAHVSPSTLVARACEQRESVTWAGGGAHAHAAQLRETAGRAGMEFCEQGDSARDVDGERVWTLARAADDYADEMARLGLIRSLAGDVVRAEDLRAEYVRLSDAELKERCRG
ncbi:MAG: tRNA (adenosine(37)-N6)-threonylcarbamoyltransferase complex dimerization subunit type 1 TsaB [Acidobacteria bacterium]|nr:tRNA (adenosine(37)-N6)-threonylcarbamoyltransferase complex dimerization subunit type 1 TsaB [Acidobacteriota bacterium]